MTVYFAEVESHHSQVDSNQYSHMILRATANLTKTVHCKVQQTRAHTYRRSMISSKLFPGIENREAGK